MKRLCPECNEPVKGRSNKIFCSVKHRGRFKMRKWRSQLTPEQKKIISQRDAPYKAQHYQANKEKYREYKRHWVKEHPERIIELRKANRRKQREIIIKAYGGKCECCGESQYEFLAIDHISGGGRHQMERLTGGYLRWFIRNNFPSGYRILCHNCNMAIGFYSICPHVTLAMKPKQSIE